MNTHLVEVLLQVLGVDERDDAVQREPRLDILVHEKGLRDGCGVSEARGLDDDAVKVQLAGLSKGASSS